MTRDPWYFQRWAFDTPTGNPVRKAVLSMLAMMADAETGRCEAKQETIAHGVEAGERAVRGHLKALEDAGIIARRPQFRAHNRGRRGDEFLLLAPGVTEWPDGSPVQPAPPAGPPTPGTDRPDHPAQIAGAGTTALENDHASKQEQGARASKPDPRTQLPDDFPSELRPHMVAAYRILRAIAEQHPTAWTVWPRSLAKVIAAHPRHPLVATAHELDVWAVDPPRPIQNLVSTYQTFLGKRRELAATEVLAADGTPTNARQGPLAGVHPIRGRRARSQDWRAGSEAIMDVARRPRVAAELAGTVLRSEGHSAAADLVDRVGLHEALGLARAEAAPPDGWAQAGAS